MPGMWPSNPLSDFPKLLLQFVLHRNECIFGECHDGATQSLRDGLIGDIEVLGQILRRHLSGDGVIASLDRAHQRFTLGLSHTIPHTSSRTGRILDTSDFEGDVGVRTVFLELAEIFVGWKPNFELPVGGRSGGAEELTIQVNDSLEKHVAANVPV